MRTRMGTRTTSLLLSIMVSLLFVACSSGEPAKTGDKVILDFWGRSANNAFNELLVKEYNSTHKTQIKYLGIPDTEYLSKFGNAVASGTVPDLVDMDVVQMPGLTKGGSLQDITAFAKQLPNYDTMAKSYIRLSSDEDKIYGLPFNVDASALFYNKDLFRKAGLDPEKPPTSWAEIETYSRKITALGDDTKGFYFAGNCVGCNAYTFLPLVWASGGDILSEDGKQATFDNIHVKEALTFYNRLWKENQLPSGAKNDNGSNFLTAFTTGKVGMEALGAFAINSIKTQHPDLDFGVAYLPGKDGKSSSFAGGDVIAIPNGTSHRAEAEEFITWLFSDKVQVDIIAKNNYLPARSDLASNTYSQKDPRIVLVTNAMSEGRVNYSTRYNELINATNGPFSTMFQKAVFDGDIDGATNEAQQTAVQIVASS